MEKSNLRKWENNPNNEYIKGSDENQPRSREIAKKYLYKKNREKYSKPWGAYIVHHINGKTLNDTPENLFICDGKKEHDWIHGEQIRRKRKFKDRKEIENFLIKKRAEGTQKLTNFIEAKKNKEQNYLPSITITKPSFISENIEKMESEIKERKKEVPKRILKEEAKINVREQLIKPREEMRKRYEAKKKEVEERHKNKSNKKIEVIKEKKSKWKKYLFIGIIILVIVIMGYFYLNNQNPVKQAKNYHENNNLNSIPEQPKIEPIIVTGSKTDVIIKNNQQKAISLNVTYKIYSNWFGKNSTESKVFEINAEEEKSFKVYNNDGCNTAPCSVSILNFEEV